MNTRRRGAISRLARPCDGGFGGVVAFLLGLTLLAPAAAAADVAGVTPAVLPECRFLSLGADGAEQRPEMSEETLKRLFGVLSKTPIGRLVVESLDKYHRQGVGGDSGRRLRFFEVTRDMGPSAEYFENGELHVSARLLTKRAGDDAGDTNRLYTAASFVVHEAVHAIAHHLYLENKFNDYQADTKVNEALAYFIQSLFLNEIHQQFPDYVEEKAVPIWDQCTARIVSILKTYGITPAMQLDQAYDRFAELQLESDEPTALRLMRLWQYFQFLHDSEDSALLWRLEESDIPKMKVVQFVTDMIWLDVERHNCDFDNTFSLMKNRIILYANYPDAPDDVTPCEYFTDFVRALRSEDELSNPLRDRIDLWLKERQRNRGEAAGDRRGQRL